MTDMFSVRMMTTEDRQKSAVPKLIVTCSDLTITDAAGAAVEPLHDSRFSTAAGRCFSLLLFHKLPCLLLLVTDILSR